MITKLPTRVRRQTVPVAIVLAGLFACVSAPRAALSKQSSDMLEVDVFTASDSVARVAHVRASFDGAASTVTLTRQSSGRFAIQIPSGATRVVLHVAVPEHGIFETSVRLPAERPARFRVRPRPLIPAESMANVRAVGDFNGFQARPSDRLVPTSRGTLRVAIPFTGDSSRFQLRGVGGPSNAAWVPTPSFAVAPDSVEEVSFAGIARPIRDSLVFELDTSRLRYRSRRPELTTMTADSVLARVNSLSFERIDAFRHTGVLRFFRPSERDSTMSRALTLARSLLADTVDARVRTEALITLILAWSGEATRPVTESRALLALHSPSSDVVRDNAGVDAIARAVIFAESPTNATEDDSLRMQERIVARSREYLLPTARDSRADATVRRSAYTQLVYAIASYKARTGLDAILDEAITAFPNDPGLAKLPSAFGSKRILREGTAFPAFQMASLDSANATITNETFRGKLTLIDVWATWCMPCIEEMPVLHRAFERYRGRGFTILSISIDESVAPVAKLRGGKWPMPWLHAWSSGGFDSHAMKALGIAGLPTAVLVDSAGQIITVNQGLRGDALERTLGRLLR